MNISIIDLSIIALYLVGITIIGIWAGGGFKKQTSNNYFLAGRSLGWGVVGASLFASNISTVHIVGFAESGFTSGLSDGIFEWMAIPCLVFLGVFIAPFYFRNNVQTIPQYFERRFDGASRTFMVIFAILTALLIHIGISLYAGATIMKEFFGLDQLWGVLLISFLTALYTIVGGLKAVAVTESIQSVMLLGGSILITLFGIAMLPEAGITSFELFRSEIKPGSLSMLRSDATVAQTGGIPWYAVFLGYPVLGIWYWFTDQTIVQRALGSRSENDARIGPMFTAVLKLAPVFFMLLPGLLAYVLFRDEINAAGTGQTFSILVAKLLPVGLAGLVIASLLAALMSSVAAALNSSSTLVSMDIVKRMNPSIDDDKLVWIGKVTTFLVMVIAILFSLVAGAKGGSIITIVNSIGSSIAPSISAVFILGYFWKRGTKEAAKVTFGVGLVLGVLMFVLDFPNAAGVKLITDTWGIIFMMQAWWGFVFCCAVFVVVSYLTPAPTAEQQALSFTAKAYFDKIKSIADYRIIGIGVMVLLIVLWAAIELIA
ncbi:sodium:solute symporter family transporter [Marinoscillum furvescens]|uniref:SSS family solute:Na+ symporter n=1 Tax=Marinoscillum furvescens DSM 4134 TaxID=1122208 RepID=A0A3D9L035_MARFU|nr:sodium/solute symporter [Marinoscillum furvescens]RED96549.1 SSS family solute:Na+ symporter [Marinoscillum furvescens DSM 4134]